MPAPAPARARQRVVSAAAPSRRPAPVRRVAPAPARPDLRVVSDSRVQAADRRRRLRVKIVGAGVLAAIFLFALAASHAVLVTGQGRLDQLEAEVVEAQTRYSANRLRVAELESPARIVQAAQTLGMVPPPGVTYLTPSVPVDEAGGSWSRGTDGGDGDTGGGSSWAAIKPYLAPQP